MKILKSTPWGKVKHYRVLSDDIVYYETAKHGGYKVSNKLVNQLPEKYRNWAKRWSGKDTWYEQGTVWAALAITFPKQFDPISVVVAEKIIEHLFMGL